MLTAHSLYTIVEESFYNGSDTTFVIDSSGEKE